MMTISKDERIKYFNYLLSSVNHCDLCNRMCNRKKVLSINNGNLNSKVVFIAEAPGRLGAECTGIPLYGDKTGDNFEMLLKNIGWKRNDIFITNAILCNPQDEKGNNSTPTQDEIANCSYYLEMTLELLNPEIIVTLGVKALEALKYIKYHNYLLRDSVAQKVLWNDRFLFPLYHVGPRAIIHRGIIEQKADFFALSHIVDPIKGINTSQSKKTENIGEGVKNTLLDMVMEIIKHLKKISFFKLTKLLYLIDFNYYKEFGNSMSGSIYLRMQEGPWIPTLKNITKEFDKIYFSTTFDKRKPIISHIQNNYTSKLTIDEKKFVHGFISKYADSSDANMKTAAYKTEPMRYILKQENNGRNMQRRPVLYKDSSIQEMDKGMSLSHN